MLGTIVRMLVEIVVIAVIGGLAAFCILKQMTKTLFVGKRGELDELNRQIAIARSEHGLVRDQLATIGALEDDPGLLDAFDREARLTLLGLLRAQALQAQGAQSTYADASNDARVNGVGAQTDEDQARFEKLAEHYQALADVQAERGKQLTHDIAVAIAWLKSAA